MRRVGIMFINALLVLLWLTAGAQGDLLPHKTVQEMCFAADLIVAGTDLGNGKVRVDHVFYASVTITDAVKTVEAPSITKHNKIIKGIWARGKDVLPITTNQLVLFLRQAKDGALEPFHMIGKGSQGLFWYDGEGCYGYEQIMNPGPYVLMRYRTGARRIPSGKEAMWRQIKVGLAQRKRWEAIEAIQDRAERARQMGAYLLPHTAPEGYAQAVNLRKVIGKIGPEAVPALIEVLEKARPDDKLNIVVLTLYDIGCAHPQALRPAVPALCKLLKDPGPNSLYYILAPLKAAGDPRAISHVRPMLKHASKQVRAEAARALAAMKDQKSFGVIAALIGNSANPADRLGYTLKLARSLFELDAARARSIIERVESTPGNAGLQQFIPGYDQPDQR